jgi:hypothetical protein
MRNWMAFSSALLMLSASAASAQEASRALPAETAKKNLVQGSLGLGSPVGALGISYTYAPIRQIEIEIGGGLGFTGYQLSAMPKLSLGNSNDRFVVGLGPSVSIDTWQSEKQTHLGYWLNGEVGYEHRTWSGLSVLVAVGVTYGLAGAIPRRCGSDCVGGAQAWDEPIAGRVLPQGRIALGRWF